MNIELLIAEWCQGHALWLRACGLDEEAREWTRRSDYWRAKAEKRK